MTKKLFITGGVFAVLILFGIVGRWDYDSARLAECASYQQGYDFSNDVCIKTVAKK